MTHYYGYDGGLHVRSLSDATGAVMDTFAYDAYGHLVARTGTTANDYLFRGEQYDAALGMYYLRARWYRPQVGRFLTQDAYEGDEDEPRSLHGYLYAWADPTNLLDPSGHGSIIDRAFLNTVVTAQRALQWVNTRIGIRTLGQVRRGADIASEAVCCLDRAWSVLDLALKAIAIAEDRLEEYEDDPVHQALLTIDEVCRLSSGSCRAFAGHKKGKRKSTEEKHAKGDERRGRDQSRGRYTHWPGGKPDNYPKGREYPPRDKSGKIIPPNIFYKSLLCVSSLAAGPQ